MSAEKRLSSEQLAALAPGDVVTIESGVEFGRRRYMTGRVARLTGRHVVVNCGRYVECYGLRDGIREGGTGHAELVADGTLQERGGRGRSRRVDLLYGEWARNRTDLERLQALHEAIGELLEKQSTSAL